MRIFLPMEQYNFSSNTMVRDEREPFENFPVEGQLHLSFQRNNVTGFSVRMDSAPSFDLQGSQAFFHDY